MKMISKTQITPLSEDISTKLATLKAKLQIITELDPFFIDLSLRENPFGDRIGQTLQEKLAILPQLRTFGFQNILLGTLDYGLPQFPEVDDDFMLYLQANNIDVTGGYAFTALGLVDQNNVFTPSLSQQKLANYGVPNTLHEIYVSDAGMASSGYDFDTLMASIPKSIAWLNANVKGGDGRTPGTLPQIFINIVDGWDAMMEAPERMCTVLSLLAQSGIAGVSIEDDRGTYLPLQVGIYVSIVRGIIPPPMKILVHMHSGAGFENAAVIEALLNGADGAWGGLPKRAAMIGHASLGELIANLVRIGNSNMNQYQLNQLLPLATNLQLQDEGEPVLEDLPILGANAYRLNLSFFQQIPGRMMDLPPEAIGGTYGYRICPVASDPPVIAGRLAEVYNMPVGSFPQDVLEQMVNLMRQDLRQGIQTVYDDPAQLAILYQRAGGEPLKQSGKA
jgi:HMGL-like